MGRDYIPRSDAGRLAFAQNMVARVQLSPGSYGLTEPIVAELASLLVSYQVAYGVATEMATKGRSATFQKNHARGALVAAIRRAAWMVHAALGATDSMKHDLGLTVRGSNPATPINQPTVAPVLEVLWVKNRVIGVRLRSSETSRRARPEGVQGCSVCMYAGPLPLPMDVTAWATIAESTRTSFEIELPPGIAPGTLVHLLAYWKSPRLMSGPPSAPVGVYIGGGVQQAA